MNNAKTIAFAIMFVLTISIFSAPLVHAEAGTVEDYWWKANPGMCYNAGSLNNMNVDGSTGNGSNVITETEVTRATYNAEMGTITINGDSWLNCYGKHFDVASENMADAGDLATEFSRIDPNDSESITESEIRFNTDQNWGTSTDSCDSSTDLDIEWVFNHEMGHGIGLIHHWHAIPASVMHTSCDSIIANLQTFDKTAIDIHYP